MTDYRCARTADGITHAHTAQAQEQEPHGGFSLCTTWLDPKLGTFRAVPTCPACLLRVQMSVKKHISANDSILECLLGVLNADQLQEIIDRVPGYQSTPLAEEYGGWLEYAEELHDKFPDPEAVAEVVAIYAESGGHAVAGQRFEKAMKINIKKGAIKKGQCAAMRCTEQATGEHPIDGRTLPLCDRHVEACKQTGQIAPGTVIETTAEPATPDVTGEVSTATEEVAAELASIKDFSIVTQDDMDLAAAYLGEVKSKYKTYEERLKEITRPMREAEKSVRDLFRPVLSGLSEIERLIKGEISKFELEKERRNKEALEAAAAARAAGDVSGTAAALSQVVHVENAKGISTRPIWRFEIDDESLVPREFCSVDEAKVRAHAVLAGGQEPSGIPGVRWIQDVSVTARRT